MAIGFLANFGDGHLFALYGSRWPGLTAQALLAAAPGELKSDALQALAQRVWSEGDRWDFSVEEAAGLSSMCSGALCQILLMAPIPESLPRDHPLIARLNGRCKPCVRQDSLDAGFRQELAMLRDQDSLRGDIARLMRLF